MTAPTGWGKTRLVEELYGSIGRPILFLSPLTIINEECAKRFSSYKWAKLLRQRRSFVEYLNTWQEKKGIIFCSPEIVPWSALQSEDILIIADEIHLFFYWGKEFRPILWESLLNIGAKNFSLIGLSATMGERIIEEIRYTFSPGMKSIFWLNLGNGQIKTRPKSIENYSLLGKQFLLKRVRMVCSLKNECAMVFVRTKREVAPLVDWLARSGVEVMGCVGGGASEFYQALLARPSAPKCIVCTSVLGHGANLPDFTHVFILFHVENEDLRTQMIGRAGRRAVAFRLVEYRSIGRKWREVGALLKSFGMHAKYRFLTFCGEKF